MDLPDDVSIRTSKHERGLLRKIHALQEIWTEYAVGDDQDVLFEVMLYTMDEFDAMIFNALHGYYRQAIECICDLA